jgi:O-antigen ligase
MLFGIITNLYRGIILSFLTGLTIFFVIRKLYSLKLIFFIIFVSIILIFSIDQIQSTELFKTRISNRDTVESRFIEFEKAVDEFKKDPITGIGFSNLENYSHNTCLRFLSEIGIIGFFIVILLFYFIFYYSFQCYKYSISDNDKDFFMIIIAISLTYLITWAGLETGILPGINKLYFAIIGVMMSKRNTLLNNSNFNKIKIPLQSHL